MLLLAAAAVSRIAVLLVVKRSVGTILLDAKPCECAIQVDALGRMDALLLLLLLMRIPIDAAASIVRAILAVLVDAKPCR